MMITAKSLQANKQRTQPPKEKMEKEHDEEMALTAMAVSQCHASCFFCSICYLV